MRTLIEVVVSYVIASYLAMGLVMAFPQRHPHSPDFLIWLVSPVWPVLFLDGLLRGEALAYWIGFAVAFLASLLLFRWRAARRRAARRSAERARRDPDRA